MAKKYKPKKVPPSTPLPKGPKTMIASRGKKTKRGRA